ncbi:MAG: DUF2164 domain-containing protein [Alphaproteobacteria bacterium]|nr:DUF2164 domain-containing protein [Alphaproteobacteria bacterium]MBU1516700.1 DUF2164 domain-containing protein [Alphaproteobacteria bacterium]MBU2094456.1 DUF2164 domain-containing protein [Alphaproteobacteria bacterium]MBU2152683.1 DUF2164 domain-containing protein [Alphaproteobacteria bacterium]MBU2306175.1 DUF2164 domain-containing protein [Alphaproteobacteria bacterium]
MPPIEFPKETRDALARALSKYLKDELDLEVTGFDAVFLTDFITETLGPYFYNQGLADAQALLGKKLDEMGEAIYQLEKPVKTIR